VPGHRRSERRRAITSALVGALLATLLLPAAALAADPSSEPSAGPSAQVLATETPDTNSPSPVPSDPTDEPSATPTASPEPSPSVSAGETDDPSESPDPTGSPEPRPSDEPSPTATPGEPTPLPSGPSPSATRSPRPQTVAPQAEGDVTTLSGYRYANTTAPVYSERDTSSEVVTTLAAGTRVTVTQSVVEGGETWIGLSAPAAGHVEEEVLSATSAPVAISETRFSKQYSGTYTQIGGAWVRTVRPGTYVKASAKAFDSQGRQWINVSFVSSGVTYRGWMPYWHTTTTPVSVSGRWALVRATSLYRYPYLESPRLKSLANGAQVSRHVKVTDTSNVGWTKALSGSAWGWVLTSYLTPPFKQFIWNRSNPVTQQYTNYWCVPASVQTELNIGLNGYSTSRSFQQSAYTYGRAHMGYSVAGRGLDPESWELSLSYFDTRIGNRNVDYRDDTFSTYTSAIKWGAIQMRKTGLPVGLLVYYGGHAWTMIGFTATADPLKTMAFKVTGVYVAAPFRAWTDPPPGTYYTFAQFGKKMTPYYEQSRWTHWNGRYTIVLPISG
jgi:hypothetical protein